MSMERAFSGFASAFELSGDYPHHPDPSALLAYVQGSLPSGYRMELAADFSHGQMKDWHQAEVGLHVKTCRSCWNRVIQLRLERQAATNRATHRRVLWRLPLSTRWGLAVAPVVFALGLLLGNWMHPWTAPPEEDVGQLSPTPLSTGGLAQPEGVVQLLKSGGLDLTPFDLRLPLEAYGVQPQDTLQSIALQRWGDGAHWIVIYLFNYRALQDLGIPAREVLPSPLTLQLPALLR